MGIMQESLFLFDEHVAVLQISLADAQGFDLRSLEGDAGLVSILDIIIMTGLFVQAKNLFTHNFFISFSERLSKINQEPLFNIYFTDWAFLRFASPIQAGRAPKAGETGKKLDKKVTLKVN
jgi:hypothetical protein